MIVYKKKVYSNSTISYSQDLVSWVWFLILLIIIIKPQTNLQTFCSKFFFFFQNRKFYSRFLALQPGWICYWIFLYVKRRSYFCSKKLMNSQYGTIIKQLLLSFRKNDQKAIFIPKCNYQELCQFGAFTFYFISY